MHSAAGNNVIRSEILRRRTTIAVAMEDDLFSLSEYTRCAVRNLPLSAISRSARIQLRDEKGTDVLVHACLRRDRTSVAAYAPRINT